MKNLYLMINLLCAGSTMLGNSVRIAAVVRAANAASVARVANVALAKAANGVSGAFTVPDITQPYKAARDAAAAYEKVETTASALAQAALAACDKHPSAAGRVEAVQKYNQAVLDAAAARTHARECSQAASLAIATLVHETAQMSQAMCHALESFDRAAMKAESAARARAQADREMVEAETATTAPQIAVPWYHE